MWGLGRVVLCVALASTISQAATLDITPESSIEEQRNLEPPKIEDPNYLEAKSLELPKALDLHNQEDPRSLELSSLEEVPKTLDPLNLEPHEALDILLSLDEKLLENERNLEGNPEDWKTREESSFSMASLFNTPVASNLVSLIANAMRTKDQQIGGQKNDDGEVGGGGSWGSPPSTSSSSTSSSFSSPSSSSSSPSSSSSSSSPYSSFSLANPTTTVVSAGEETHPPTSHTVEGDDAFSPASVGQFGLPGTGSKLVDYLPDMSDYSIDATQLAPLAGASAVALLALGALFAVPVAPVILRRTGTSGWSGLPSLKDLFNWWSSPDPIAEAWADKYYQRYDHNQQQQQPHRQQRPQQHHRPDHYYDTKNYHDQGEQYYNYDTSGSSSNTDPLYQESKPQLGDDSSAPHAYHNDEPPNFATPAAHHNQPPSYAAAPQNAPNQPPARRRGPNRRLGVDGYEYVTLEQINRIGDDSLRLLGQLASGYNTEDLYAYRDGSNQLARRRLPVQPNQQQANSHQNNPQSRPYQPNSHVRNGPHQYHPRPSYQDTQTYVLDEEQVDENPYREEPYANSPYREEHYDESTYEDEHFDDQYGEHPYRDETHEKHPYRDETHGHQPFSEMFSLTEEKVTRESEETPHPYRHKYNFGAAELSDNSDVNTPQPHKVADFPYEFHKAE